MFSLLLALQQTPPVATRVPRMPAVTQTARCVGVDDRDRRQTLTLESRRDLDRHIDAVFVTADSSGVLKPGEWLENQNPMYKDGDRKQSFVNGWDDVALSKRVGARYVRIVTQRTSMDSATILYVTRPYSDRELTAMRHFNKGTILLAGRCSLFVDGKPLR